MGIVEILGIVTSIVSVILAIPEIYDLYRKDPRGFWRMLKLMGIYAVYAAAGIGIVVLMVSGPQPTGKALLATLFVLTWIGYGALWLVRLAPRVKALPAWVESWLSPIDYVMITVIALSGLSLAISQF